MLFIIPHGAPCEIAVSAHTLIAFLNNADDALTEFLATGGVVVPIKRGRRH
jgi:hypothetical protein